VVGGEERLAPDVDQVPLPSAPLARTRALRSHLAATDILHVHGTRAATWALPFLRTKRSVATLHGLHPLRRPGPFPVRAAGWALVRTIVAAADAVVCVSEADAHELARRRLGSPNVRVIQNAVPRPQLRADERATAREELGVAEGCLLVLFLGRLEEAKGPLTALAIARRLESEDVTVAVAGGGELAHELAQLAGPNVLLLGHRSDTERLLAAADVVLNTSRWEGLSLGLLEAMWAGRAIVASDVEGNAEAIGCAGILVPPDELDPFAEAVLSLRDDRKRADLGRAAAARVEERFSIERMMDEHAELYEALLSRSGS